MYSTFDNYASGNSSNNSKKKDLIHSTKRPDSGEENYISVTPIEDLIEKVMPLGFETEYKTPSKKTELPKRQHSHHKSPHPYYEPYEYYDRYESYQQSPQYRPYPSSYTRAMDTVVSKTPGEDFHELRQIKFILIGIGVLLFILLLSAIFHK